MLKNRLIVIRGGGDLASGIAYRLLKTGFQVIILEREQPIHVRRLVSFAQAVYNGEMLIEGIRSIKAESLNHLREILAEGHIPVLVNESGNSIPELQPDVVIDAILAKRNLGTLKDMAPLVIGVGPGFEAGMDVDVVIETKRGHFLGRVIWSGTAEKNTGIPGSVNGVTSRRVLRAATDGVVEPLKHVGDMVEEGELVARVAGQNARALASGVIRGLINAGVHVPQGLKIGDIDPRGALQYCEMISDKALAVGGGVLEAILSFNRVCWKK
ncbi:molybdenum hydroxylase [candidate division KSB3 bacterium]|uniref:Molybdenum hydroxylase n=1 Tax=candidate division KSB3 bacterium TaxID=2044937 RepID=A0A2G6KKT2_9BACT|nr:MAG: molybdenum hydroxylase [candidate division KSB3 bacterium]